ncbi:MAG TPA: DNA polymerase III subunit chi [Methylophilaceae bacterium]|nr:DNA polymerase III subunit chi [Methylophilaceae bacterium]
MTRIEFFFNVENKLEKVAGLADSAVKKGRRLMLYSADAKSAAAIEQYMWSQPSIGFLPHCRADHALAAETPIIIDWQGEQLVHDDVLVNLQSQQPLFFSRFRRLIEIVGVDEEDKAAARIRYRFYRDRGYEIKSFDVTGNAL